MGTELAVSELAACEERIEKSLGAMSEIFTAFSEIKEKELFKAAGFDDWESYLHTKWSEKFSPRHVRRLVSSIKMISDLRHSVKPKNEASVRPLASLDTPEERSSAYAEAVEEAGGVAPTAKQVQIVVDRKKQYLDAATGKIKDAAPLVACRQIVINMGETQKRIRNSRMEIAKAIQNNSLLPDSVRAQITQRLSHIQDYVDKFAFADWMNSTLKVLDNHIPSAVCGCIGDNGPVEDCDHCSGTGYITRSQR